MFELALQHQSVRILTITAWVILGSLNLAQPANSETFNARELQFFEAKIRPLLIEHCYACHSTESGKAEGKLLVDSRPGLLVGGESGPSLVVGDPRRSLIMRAVEYRDPKLAMPPEEAGGKLKPEEIALLDQWIRMGLPDPRSQSTLHHSETSSEGAAWWAFQPPKQPVVPAAGHDWAISDIDRFVAAEHQLLGLSPSAQAEPHVLIRRLHFDLTGLPPSPNEIDSFLRQVQESSWEAAYRKRVDELLASPQFGVHWGRHWLDVARYAESSGRDINVSYPYAWRYRDYVIDAVNRDKPYNLFLSEQIAGDLLPYANPKQHAEQLIATGFLAIGSRAINEMNPRQFALDQADEQIDTVFQASMGLTVACARCHDHKFDPIPQQDYTAVAGIFLSSKTLFGIPNIRQSRNSAKPLELPQAAHVPVAAEPISKSALADLLTRFQDIDEEMEAMRRERFQSFQANAKGGTTAPDPQRDIQKRIALEAQRAQLEAKLMEYDDEGQPVALAMAVVDKPVLSTSQSFARRFVSRDLRERVGFESIADSPFFARGELDLAGDPVPRGVPSLFGDSTTVSIPKDSSGRLELAKWITSPKNPMTARVAVNRAWNWLIGQGLVSSVDNFGTTGTTPSHPELLDHLALRFQKDWSVKNLVREIVLSATYQQSSAYNELHFKIDPENKFVWRMNPRRLEAESIRDAVLSASGVLDKQPQLASPIAKNGAGPIDRPTPFPMARFRRDPKDATDDFRGRSVYLGLPRDAQPEILALFDMPDANTVQGKRESTNVPAQSLFMMNSAWIGQQSQRLAARIVQTYPGGPLDQLESRLKLAYQLTLGRPPRNDEIQSARELMSPLGSHAETAWTSLARGLFASAEFRYLD